MRVNLHRLDMFFVMNELYTIKLVINQRVNNAYEFKLICCEIYRKFILMFMINIKLYALCYEALVVLILVSIEVT